jgi:C4-dicarboxylate transporter DctM subunit
MGIDPVHFGVTMVVNLCIGFCSPPFGLNLFVTAPLAGKSVMEVGRKVWLAIGFFMAALVLITYIPAISLFLIGR